MYGMNAPAKDFDGENKYIRITDISESSNTFIPNPLTSPDDELDDKFLLKDNDLLFARTGASTGKSYLYDKNDGKLYFAGFLIKINIINAVSRFIFYQTLRNQYNNWVKIISVRSGQPGINAEEYKNYKFKSSSLKEQQKIANFLSYVDKKITLLKDRLDSFEDFKKFCMQQLFAEKFKI